MQIRTAALEDAEAVGKVHSAAWKSAYRGIFPDEYIDEDTAAKRTEEFLDSIKDEKCTYYLLTESEKTAGIVKTREDNNFLEIESIYILDEYRGKGFGSRFIDYIRGAASNGRISLWVLETNLPARHFYENNGFVMTGDFRLINRGVKLKQVRYEYFGG